MKKNRWKTEASLHQQRVRAFMQGARQECPEKPGLPSLQIRRLRASLILEEALETVQALGFKATVNSYRLGHIVDLVPEPTWADLVGIVDGCCDTIVVTTGTLIACGVTDEAPQLLVDKNNLDKLGPGHSFRPDGKLVKPVGHQKPKLDEEIERQVSK